MARRRSRQVRIDNEFSRDLDEIMRERISKKIDKPRDISPRELTRMMRNWEGYPELKRALMRRPRRRR